MRILILNQFFHPDHSGSSQMMTDLAESLVEFGVDVTALAGRGRYNGSTPLPAQEVYNGVRIERAWSMSLGKRSTLTRLVDYFSFYLGASWKLLTLPRPDIVMALSALPHIGVIAQTVGWLRGLRVVLLVKDLHPDVAIALGALLPRRPLTHLLDYLNRTSLKKADRIIVVSECMRRRIMEKIGDERRIDVIHDWADGKKIRPIHIKMPETGEDCNDCREDLLQSTAVNNHGFCWNSDLWRALETLCYHAGLSSKQRVAGSSPAGNK